MPNMNTYFQQMGCYARQHQYDIGETRKLLIMMLQPINENFMSEVAKYFWSGYNG